MPDRPCLQRHPDPTVHGHEGGSGCRICFLFETRADYREMWGGDPTQAKNAATLRRLALPCIHLGPPTGETVPCDSCGGQVHLKTFACAVHGTCTATKRVPGVGCCGDGQCNEKQLPPDSPNATRIVELDTGGIGDTLCAVMVASGLGNRTVIRCPPNRKEWAELFADSVVEEVVPLKLAEIRQRNEPRWQQWADKAGTVAKLPAVKPLPADALEWAEPYAGRVVIAPFAAFADRTWPLENWLRVEELLEALGFDMVVLDDQPNRTSRFKSLRVVRLVNEQPARVAAVIQTAAAFVGNDSGMAHVAGFLRTPAVAICSRASDNRIMGLYPTVRELGGRYTGNESVTPADVVAAILAQMRAFLGDFPIDEFAAILAERDRHRLESWLPIYAALWRTVRAIQPAPMRIVEIGTRAGYSAWTLLRACPDATVQGFDLNASEHGGYAGACEHARRINDPERFKLTIADSHSLDRLPPCDLAYIDGDHSEKGCTLDLELAERSSVPLVLVDDYTNLEEVRNAVRRFVAKSGILGRFIPSRTGLYRMEFLPLSANQVQ